LIICCFISWYCYSSAEEKQARQVTAVILPDSIDFKTDIQPILQKKCSPCHFTGGKMYEKLPFDQASTILNHETGIFKRIKNEDEVVLFKKFIEENKMHK
jgi:hypothetical protein